MDLALSPDWPALWCYFIILAIGFVVATVQINRLFPGFPQAWTMMSNWVLFAVFLLLPLLLFWFLDRTNTLHDTSLFGAILVALAYRQIFAGNAEKVNVPGEVSKIWDRVLKWADARVLETKKRVERNADSFDEKVIDHLTHNPLAFERVLGLLKFHASDYLKIDADFKALQDRCRPLGEEVTQHKSADYLYHQLRLVTGENFTDLMYKAKITSWIDYYWYGKELRSRVVQALVTGGLVLGAAWLFYRVAMDPDPTFRADYYVIRLKKGNATEQDRSRTRRQLDELIANNAAARLHLCEALTSALRYEAMAAETAERILAVLLERRDSICESGPSLVGRLAEALRAEDPDVRARIQSALVFLAQGWTVKPELLEWKPARSDAPADVEDKIAAWWAAWRSSLASGGAR